MTIEERLKRIILSRYGSLRAFTIASDIPHSTVDTILKRGVANSNISNIVKLCKALNISVDALADGDIVPKSYNNAPLVDVRELVDDVKTKLLTGDRVVIDGHIVDIERAEPLLDALDFGYKIVKNQQPSGNPDIIEMITTESTTKNNKNDDLD